MKRQIIGRIHKLQDIPWANASGTIVLENGSYTPAIQYPESRSRYQTDSNGNIFASINPDIPLELWCNEEGSTASYYRLFLPDRTEIKFTVPTGSTPIPFSALRDNYDPPEASRVSIIEHAENYTDAAIANVTGQSSFYKSLNGLPTQSAYQLDAVSARPDKSQLYFNGQKQKYGIDYNINTTTLNIINNLPVAYILEIYY